MVSITTESNNTSYFMYYSALPSNIIVENILFTRCSDVCNSNRCYIPCSSTLSNGKEHDYVPMQHWNISLLKDY